MSLRCYQPGTDLIAGAMVCGNRGLGVLGSAVPSTGDNGPGYLYNDLTLPADSGKEVRGLILTTPSAGTFKRYEDSSFTLAGAPDGTYTFTYRLYSDGTDLGTATATITIGSIPNVYSITGSGGTLCGGSATVTFNSPVTYSITGSGGILIDGASNSWFASPSRWVPISAASAMWTPVSRA